MASVDAVKQAIKTLKAAFPRGRFDGNTMDEWHRLLQGHRDDAVTRAADSFATGQEAGEWPPNFPQFLHQVSYFDRSSGRGMVVNPFEDDLTRRRDELLKGDFDEGNWSSMAGELEAAGKDEAALSMRRRIEAYL